MSDKRLAKYGVEYVLNFELYDVSGANLKIDAADGGADCTLRKNQAADATATNDFVDEGLSYSLTITATEMQAKEITVHVVDQTAAKVWLDKTIVIATYGNASALHAMDFDDAVRGGLTALPNAAADNAGGLPISDVGGLDLDAMNTNVNDIETDLANGTDGLGALKALIDTMQGNVTDVLGDTAELQTNQGNWLTATGFATSAALATHDGKLDTLDLVADLILADTTLILGDTAELQTNQGNWVTAVGFSTHSAADVWAVAVRVLTAGTNLNNLSAAEAQSACNDALVALDLDHWTSNGTAVPAVTAGSYLDLMLDDGTEVYNRATDSLQAIRDRGDAGWITGGGAGITDILNIHPLIPLSIDLADTATMRLGLMLLNSLDDLPSTAEITPGTISIDRKVIGGTTWTSVIADAACSEIAGLIYYDEVFDAGTGYEEGDIIRVTFKSQKITVAANDYEVIGATGRMFYSQIHETMRGTNSANTVVPDVAGTAPTAAEITTDIDANSSNLDTIIANIAALNNISVANVLAQVLAALDTAISGPTAESPLDVLNNIRMSAKTIVPGAAEAGTLSTTQMTSDLTEATDEHYNGRIIIWTSGVLFGQATDITAYLGSTGRFTYTAVTEAPGVGDTFVIV